MIVTFESQNVTNVQQCVTVLFRDRNEWRSICHFCFRGCVYHYSNSAPKKSGVSFRHDPADVYATGRLFLLCCNTSTRWDPRHGSMHVRVKDGHFPNDCVIGRFERDNIVMSAHTNIFVLDRHQLGDVVYCTERTLHLKWCQTSETLDNLTPGLPPVHKRQVNPVVIINTSSELNPAACECSSSSSNQFQKSTADIYEDECSCCCYVDGAADGDS